MINIQINVWDGDSRMYIAAVCRRSGLRNIQRIHEEDPELFARCLNRGIEPYSATPLRLAASNGCFEVAKYLILQGAQVDVVDRKGQTPLFCAVQSNHYELVNLLLSHGASPDGSPLNRLTPLELCLSDINPSPDIRIYLALLKAGANLQIENSSCCMLCALLSKKSDIYLRAYYEFGGHLRECVCQLKRLQYMESNRMAYFVSVRGPLSLQCLCRIKVRKILNQDQESINSLPLPPALIDFLNYMDY